MPRSVTNAVNGPNGFLAQLATQGGDVRIDGALARWVVVSPDVTHELLAREDDAGPRSKHVEKVELGDG